MSAGQQNESCILMNLPWTSGGRVKKVASWLQEFLAISWCATANFRPWRLQLLKFLILLLKFWTQGGFSCKFCFVFFGRKFCVIKMFEFIPDTRVKLNVLNIRCVRCKVVNRTLRFVANEICKLFILIWKFLPWHSVVWRHADRLMKFVITTDVILRVRTTLRCIALFYMRHSRFCWLHSDTPLVVSVSVFCITDFFTVREATTSGNFAVIVLIGIV